MPPLLQRLRLFIPAAWPAHLVPPRRKYGLMAMLSAAARRLNSRSSASLRGWRPLPRSSPPRRDCTGRNDKHMLNGVLQQHVCCLHLQTTGSCIRCTPTRQATARAPAAHPAQGAHSQQDQLARRREAGGGQHGGGRGAAPPDAGGGWVAAVCPLVLLVCALASSKRRLRVCHGRGVCRCQANQAEGRGRGAHGTLGTLRHAAGIEELHRMQGEGQTSDFE